MPSINGTDYFPDRFFLSRFWLDGFWPVFGVATVVSGPYRFDEAAAYQLGVEQGGTYLSGVEMGSVDIAKADVLGVDQ